jgi:zinc D-Ala-D-Ala carboxypeptidase
MDPMRPRRSPPRRPVRRQPAYIYRRRRLAAGLTTLVLVVLLWRVVTGGNGDGEETADTTSSTAPATTTTTIPAPPACTIGDEQIPDDPTAAWSTIIVDTNRRLAPDYQPPDLVDAAEAGFPTGFRVRTILIADLRSMREAAAASSVPIGLIAAYRTYEQQGDLYTRREQQLGAEVAKQRAARAGHSEHQLGTAIDVGSQGDVDVTQDWGASPTGQWVAAHAHEHGFIVSYPQGKIDKTCYDYEPWHLRYVGREIAAAVHASGLTLREHLWARAQGATPGATTTTARASTDTTTG